MLVVILPWNFFHNVIIGICFITAELVALFEKLRVPLARRQVQQLVRYLDIDGDKRVGLAEMQALLDLARVVKSAKEKETQQSKDGQQEPESGIEWKGLAGWLADWGVSTS